MPIACVYPKHDKAFFGAILVAIAHCEHRACMCRRHIGLLAQPELVQHQSMVRDEA